METGNSTTKLAEIALALADHSGLEDVCKALANNKLARSSTAAIRATVAGGNTTTQVQIQHLQEIWKNELPDVSGVTIAFILQSLLESAKITRNQYPATQVVWTGPKIEGSYLRSTREVIREILRQAQRELLVIGYWIAAREEGEGIIEEVIDTLANAVGRGVLVTVIVDERARYDGVNNRQVLIDSWPDNIPLPNILTWKLPLDDRYLKLHAKVLVADSQDALVTSANLTFYALDKNMEMGVRLTGRPALSIADHFKRMIAEGIVVEYSGR